MLSKRAEQIQPTEFKPLKEVRLPVVENFFALEGLDGVGKSTTIAGLQDQGFIVYKTPPEEMEYQRVFFEATSLEDRLKFYLAGVARVGQQAKLNEGLIQFSDRFLLTTLSAHEAMGLSRVQVRNEIIHNPGIFLAKKTIFLTASRKVRMQRLMQRGLGKNDLVNLKINDQIAAGFYSWARELRHLIIEIDTNDLSPEEVVQAIINETQKNE